MCDQQSSAVGVRVDRLFHNMDIPKRHVVKIPQQFVVIPWDVDDFGAVFGFAQNRSHYVVVRLWPEEALFHLPNVDDVTNEVEKFTVDRVKKVKEVIGATATKAQMDVGNPNRAVRQRAEADRLIHPASQ